MAAQCRQRSDGAVRWRLAKLALLASLGTSVAAADEFEAALDAFRRGDVDAALPDLQRLGRAGDARAQGLLAGAYLEARGVAADDLRAMGWLCLLVHHREGGRVVMRAAWSLAEFFRTGGALPGRRYQRGDRGREDPRRAYFWFSVMAGQSGRYAQEDEASRKLGRLGMRSVRRELFESEVEVLEAALEAWGPERRFDSPQRCLALPDPPLEDPN